MRHLSDSSIDPIDAMYHDPTHPQAATVGQPAIPDHPPGNRIASAIGGRIGYDLPGSPHATKYIIGVKESYEKVIERLEENGLKPFFDPHWAHWGGKDYCSEGAPEGAWYHVTVGYPYRIGGLRMPLRAGILTDLCLPPPWITIHEDAHEPGTWDHFCKDFVPQVISRMYVLRNRLIAPGRG